ncbi:VTT domain-containing protein [Lacticaseibacillus thailandensis]|uniref:VTT domain-containing protein n=1 Tax=Lacticaseibacillus thailandensis TaxID=381741 RepID=UPI0006CF77CA|nr:VTT domain-containing protein [Lacticaseibacillus thailandensis]
MRWLRTDWSSRRGRVVTIIVALVLVAILGYRYWDQLNALWRSARHYKAWLLAMRTLGPVDLLIFTALLVIMANIPGVPISVLAFFGGVCFGHWRGFMVDAVGMTCGNMLQTYLFGQVGRKRQPPDTWLYRLLVNARRPEIVLAIGYAVPMIPTMFVNVAANRVTITRRRYVAACVLGTSTVAFVYAFGGDLVTSGQWPDVLVVVIVACVAAAIAWAFTRVRRHVHNTK